LNSTIFSARDWASGGDPVTGLSMAVFSRQIRPGRVDDRAAEHAHRKSRGRDEEEMRSSDNSRYRPHYGMDTLKRVCAGKGRRAALLPCGAA